MPVEVSGHQHTDLWDIALPTEAPHLPGASMAGFHHRSDAGPLDLRTAPQPALMLAIEFGDGPLVVEGPDGVVHRGSLATGLTTKALPVRGSDIECVQVRLSPLIAGAVLGVAAGDLGGGVVALDELWGADAERLRTRLRDASWPERFGILDATLSHRRHDGPGVEPETAHAWDLINRSRGQLRIEDLAVETGWSRKRLWSRFRDQIGIPPKLAARVTRFDRAVHRLASGVGAAQVAAEEGYADQSHLNRDVVGFLGTTPREVPRSPWLAVDEIAWPDR